MLIGDSPHLWTVAAVSALGVAVIVLLRICWPLHRSRRHTSRWLGKKHKTVPMLPPARRETPSMAA